MLQIQFTERTWLLGVQHVLKENLSKNAMKSPTILNGGFSWLGVCLVAVYF